MHRKTVRSEIKDFEPYTSGLSIAEIKKRYNLSTVIKMGSNENPLGTSPLVQKEIQRQADYCFRYPRPGSPELTKALSTHLGISQECIVIGNGSDELIDLLLRVKARPGLDNVVIFEPSFSLYRLQAKLCGLEIRKVPLNSDFSFAWDSLLKQTDQNTALVFLTNPDNPSGYATSKQQILKFSQKLPENCFLVLDEAYIDFTQDQDRFSPLSSDQYSEESKIVILRTFSKMYGLAGLRLGYGIMPAWLSDFLLRVKLPFSVNMLAEKAGLAALKDKEFFQLTKQTVLQERYYLHHEMEKLSCKVFSSQANFLMFQPPIEAKHVFESLLAKGIIIRPLQSYGLPKYLRVSVGNKQENRLFISSLEEVLHDKI